MKVIHCNVWGDIQLSDLAMQIVDCPYFQRLHHIKQNGFSYRVFPTAKTSRFEHSLGVYFITKYTLLHLDPHDFLLDPHKKEMIAIAGLVHDIGHGPFSHWTDNILFENVSNDIPWKHHEQRSCDIFEYMVNHYQIPISSTELYQIQQWIRGQSTDGNWYDQLIHSSTGLDMDKLDYLLRDIKSYGLAYQYDPYRIIRNVRIIQNELCVCERVKDEILILFLVRRKLRQQIYSHPKIVQIETFIKQQLSHSSFQESLDLMYTKNIVHFLSWDDHFIERQISPSILYHRPPRYEENTPRILPPDHEWENIKQLKFYNRKNINQSFLITDWNLVSCFDA